MNAPVIRFEVEGMKFTVLKMLAEQQAVYDETVRAAVASFPWEERIQAHVRQLVDKLLSEQIAAALWRVRETLGEKVQAQVEQALAKEARR